MDSDHAAAPCRSVGGLALGLESVAARGHDHALIAQVAARPGWRPTSRFVTNAQSPAQVTRLDRASMEVIALVSPLHTGQAQVYEARSLRIIRMGIIVIHCPGL